MAEVPRVWPQVSLVIPVYNGARFLAEAIQSALDLDYPTVDVIVVDDGSTDGSAAVAAEFGRAVRLVRLPENRGPAAARNAGIRGAGGEILAFLDADDRLPPDKLVTQVGFLQDHPDVDLVLGHQKVALESGQPMPGWLVADRATGTPVAACAMSLVTWRRIFETVGPFDESYRSGEDMEWLFRCRTGGIRIATVSQAVLVRRIHADNISHRVLGAGAGKEQMLQTVHRLMARARRSGGGKARL